MKLGYQLNFENEHKIETKMFSTLNIKSHTERHIIEYGSQVYISKVNEGRISKFWNTKLKEKCPRGRHR